MILSLTLLLLAQLAVQHTSELPLIEIPPEVAATHILKKGAPVYPAFARAVGIQGVVRIRIEVGPTGRVNAAGGVITGWACLEDAARDAAGRYEFRPFVKDGHPALAQTSVDVTFKLPESGKTYNPPPPPPMPEKWDDFRNAQSPGELSPELRKWLASYLPASGFSDEALDHAVAEEIPTKNPSVRLYVVTEHSAVECGTGGCPIQLVEQSARGVRLLFSARPTPDFYAYARPGAVYPDIFIESRFVGISGYSEVGGEWVLLYCGNAEVHVCR
jgi:TonB family protein